MTNSKKPTGKTAKKGAHAVDKIFSKIGEKTGVNKKDVDAWQKKWLAISKNRTKYESVKDVPMVMGEEIFAIGNDIIEFCQGEHGGDSHIFGKIKEDAIKAKAFVEKKAKAAKKAMK